MQVGNKDFISPNNSQVIVLQREVRAGTQEEPRGRNCRRGLGKALLSGSLLAACSAFLGPIYEGIAPAAVG